MSDKSYLIDVTVAEVSMLYVAYADSEEEARKKWREGDVVFSDGPYKMDIDEPRIYSITDRSKWPIAVEDKEA